MVACKVDRIDALQNIIAGTWGRCATQYDQSNYDVGVWEVLERTVFASASPGMYVATPTFNPKGSLAYDRSLLLSYTVGLADQTPELRDVTTQSTHHGIVVGFRCVVQSDWQVLYQASQRHENVETPKMFSDDGLLVIFSWKPSSRG